MLRRALSFVRNPDRVLFRDAPNGARSGRTQLTAFSGHKTVVLCVARPSDEIRSNLAASGRFSGDGRPAIRRDVTGTEDNEVATPPRS
jgi:hypothetical protein